MGDDCELFDQLVIYSFVLIHVFGRTSCTVQTTLFRQVVDGRKFMNN